MAEPKRSNSAPRKSTAARNRQLYLTIFICLLAAWMALPFLTPIAWAAVLAIAEWPLYDRALKRWPGRPMTIALLLAFATAMIILLPLSMAAVTLASESQTAIDWLQTAQRSGVPAPHWLGGLPLVGGRLVAWWQQHLTDPHGAQAALATFSFGSLLTWLRAGAGEVAKDSVQFLITFVFLAAVLVRGKLVAEQTEAICGRMFGDFGEDFVKRMTGAVRSTVNGTLLVSFAEGALIGIGYMVTDVPQPLLFATVTIILALIPFGAWLAFGLASAILLGSGATLAAILLFVGSAMVMTIGDNVVQPAVIGSAVELPFIFAMVGAFGGLAALGLVGLFIGPVIMAALILVLEEWTRGQGQRS